MLTSATSRFSLAAALLAVLVAALPGHACDPSSEADRSDIANARAVIAAACDCAGMRHGSYVRCAVTHANAALANKTCTRFVRKCASRSTCGRRGAVTCCIATTKGTRCKIRRGASRCAASHGTVGSCTSCCDACPAPGSGPSCPASAIRVISNRPDLMSGGDALVEVVLPPSVDSSAVTLDVDGRDVTSMFAVRPNGRYMGLLTGLALGSNVVTAHVAGVDRQVTITNHPNGGPVFSGPQLQPWVCQANAVDAQCNQPVEYSYMYQSTDPSKSGLQPYDLGNPPSDVAMTTTDRGVTVPFIVRQELGYEDRDQYRILTLFQPGQPWKPWAPQAQWNHKLLITHGGGCGVTYGVGDAPLDDYAGTLPPTAGVPESYVVALGRGFAVLSTSLDNNGHNCNIVTQAESFVMAKEHLVEAYGELRYTIGTGCSGGSLTQQQVANAYPGIYQGLLPTCSFPDTWTSATQVGDYHLLRAYFEDPSKWGAGVVWTPSQFAAVEGNQLPFDAIVSDIGFFAAAIPTNPCGGVSNQQRYDPQTNPGGVRCGIADYTIAVFGPRLPSVWSANEQLLGHGFAGLAIDNVGVQYGLAALQQGMILPLQFVDLNVKIGGVNIDIEPVQRRLAADEPALANAYRSGAINETTSLDQVAIIDGRGPDPGAAHDSYRAFAIRGRLDREHGSHANHVIWEGPTAIIGDTRYTVDGLIAIDRWLSAVEQDHSTTPLARKIVQDKPADINDRCSDGNGNKVSDGLCPAGVVPVYGTPRTVAGDAITTDANKCQLKPLDRTDNYGLIPFTDDQWAQMVALFPAGVCDFSLPAVDQQPTISWQTYQGAAGNVIYGGQALPPAPVGVAPGCVSEAVSRGP